MGAGKAQRYGKEFIEIIKKYVEEKEIIRPLDMVVKSVVNKSGMKVYIIQSIDMKRSLEDIAEAKGLEMAELAFGNRGYREFRDQDQSRLLYQYSY